MLEIPYCTGSRISADSMITLPISSTSYDVDHEQDSAAEKLSHFYLLYWNSLGPWRFNRTTDPGYNFCHLLSENFAPCLSNGTVVFIFISEYSSIITLVSRTYCLWMFCCFWIVSVYENENEWIESHCLRTRPPGATIFEIEDYGQRKIVKILNQVQRKHRCRILSSLFDG